MANFPDVIETRAHEVNDDGSETVGTIIDALDANWTYDLLAALQTWVGPNTDTAASASHEGRLQAIEALSLLTNPLTTLGDLLYSGDGSGTPARLGVGTADQVLTVVAGLPAWADATGGSGFADPMLTAGDLIVRNASNVTDRLPIGAAGQLLGVVAGEPAWTTPAFIADPSGAPVGAVLVKNAGSVWSYVAPTTSGYVLTDNGPGALPSFQVIPISSPGTGITTPGGVRVGDFLQYNQLGAWVSLHPGTPGQVLTAHGDNNVVGSLLTWATPAVGLTNPMTTLSDLLIGLTGGTPGRLGIGSNGQVLSVVAGAPAWITNPSGFADPLTTRGDLIVRGASGTTRLGLGATGTVLTSNGTDAGWAAAVAGTVDYATAYWLGGD